MKKDDIIIRKFQLSDLNELYNVLSDPEVMRYIEPPYSLAQTEKFLITAGLCEPPLIFAAGNWIVRQAAKEKFPQAVVIAITEI